MADFSGYGLDPAIVNYVQGAPQAVTAAEYPVGGIVAGTIAPPQSPPPPPQPPPPPPPGGTSLGTKNIGETGAPTGGEVPAYGLDPAIVQGVQSGFSPPVETVPSVTGGALPQATDMGMAPTAQPAAPDLAPVAVPQMTPKQVAASNKAYDKQQAATAQYDASPEGLAAKADAEQRGAIAKEQQANTDALAAEQAQNTATANALTASQQRQAEQDKIDQAKQAEDQANVQKYTQQYAQQVKDAANYKVDANRDVGVRGLIAIALSGIGNALDHNHGPNAAAQIIESQIDKRIADQWAQKGALKDKAADTKGVLSTFRQTADDDRQAQAIHTAAETKRVADEIRQIGAQYANPAAKARAEAVAASLDQKSALITQSEAQRKADSIRQAQEEADRKAGLGIQYAHLGLARDQFTASRIDAARDFALKAAELDAKGDKAKAAQMQQVAEGGVFQPTGINEAGQTHYEPLVQEDGKTPLVVPEKEREKVADAQQGTVQALNALDKLREMRDENGGNWSNLSADAKLKLAEYERALVGMHKASGISGFRGNVMEVMDKQLTGGADPTAIITNVDKLLDNARTNIVQDYNDTLRTRAKYTGKPVDFPDPVKLKAPKTPEQESFQNAMEFQAKDASNEDLGISNEQMIRLPGIQRQQIRAQALAENGGISPSVKQTIDTLAATSQSDKVDAKARDSAAAMLLELSNKAVDPAVKAYASQKSQPSLSDALAKPEAQ